MKKMQSNPITEIAPQEIAEVAGLVYVNDQKPGITRRLKGDHFIFIGLDGKTITDEKEIQRIRTLAIPPAYTDVWISPKANGHIQATGRDAKGRKQYRYHKRWREVCDETKYTKMVAFAEVLPNIRKSINRDLALSGMQKEKILAAIVHLLETTLIRIGNEEYARDNHSYGLTTLRNKHVDVKGQKITFKFRGKSGQHHTIALNDRRLANIVKRCKDLPGQDLFEYIDDDDKPIPITSTDVNDYLQAITQDHFTAKDFRTWAGTVFAVFALQQFEQFDSPTQAKKNIVQAIEIVAKKLGNTPSICRKCYIHPEILNAYLEGKLLKLARQQEDLVETLADLTKEEMSVLAFIKERTKPF